MARERFEIVRQFSILRFTLAAAMIVVTAIVLQARGSVEIIRHGSPFSSFPAQLGNWSGKDVPLDPETLEVLGPGQFLERFYESRDGNTPYIDLFLAYFPSQRTGDTIHSPKNCLPGAGWTARQAIRVTLSLPGHAPFPANRYLIAKGDERRLVLYWFWAHDRGLASEYWAKYYLVRDAIVMNRSDGALVRLVTQMLPGETPNAALERLLPFASYLAPLLNDYIPR